MIQFHFPLRESQWNFFIDIGNQIASLWGVQSKRQMKKRIYLELYNELGLLWTHFAGM